MSKSIWEEEWRKPIRMREEVVTSSKAMRGFYRLNISVGRKSKPVLSASKVSSSNKSVNSSGRAGAKFDYLVREGDYDKGKAEGHFDYIERQMDLDRDDDFVTSYSKNMPSWVGSPKDFWVAADEFERANGTLYREVVVNFDNGFTMEQNLELVKEFTDQLLGEKHAYTVAIHNPKTLDKSNQNPHAHIIFSERINDNVERPRELYFKRYNSKFPERGGAKKEASYSHPKTNKSWLLNSRELWADLLNAHAKKHGINKTFDHRTLAEQGLNHVPETRLPLSEVNKFKHQGSSKAVATLFEARQEKSSMIDSASVSDVEQKRQNDLVEIYQEAYHMYTSETRINDRFRDFMYDYNSSFYDGNPDALNDKVNRFVESQSAMVNDYLERAENTSFVKFKDVLVADPTYVSLQSKFDILSENYDTLDDADKRKMGKVLGQMKLSLNHGRESAFKRMKQQNDEAMLARASLAHAQKDVAVMMHLLRDIKSKIADNQPTLIPANYFASEADKPTFNAVISDDKGFDYYRDNPSEFIQPLVLYNEKFSEHSLDKSISNLTKNSTEAETFKQLLITDNHILPDGDVFVDSWGDKDAVNLGQFFTTKDYLDSKSALVAKTHDLSTDGRRFPIIDINEARPYPELLRSMANNPAQIFAVNGVAGSGKSYAMSHFVDIMRSEDRINKVIGLSLTGKASKNIAESVNADESMTIHKFEDSVRKGALWLDEKSVIIMDEAGMTGTGQMNRVVDEIRQSGAKLVLLGDTKQLSSVEAGTAFSDILNALPDHLKYDTTEVFRQQSPVHREATSHLFNDDIDSALDIYSNEGSVHVFSQESDLNPMEEAIGIYLSNLEKSGNQYDQNLVMAHKRVEVDQLNSLIRKKLGFSEKPGLKIQREGGREVTLAEGEYIRFTRNQKLPNGVSIKNGEQANIIGIDGDKLVLKNEINDCFEIDTNQYKEIDYGYAMTIHQSQGVTVDDAVLYASMSVGKEATYVGFTRHKNNFDVIYDETVRERPEITSSSDYFQRIGQLNTKQQKHVGEINALLNNKLDEAAKSALNDEIKAEAYMAMEMEYQVSERTNLVVEQAKQLYSESPLSAAEALDSHVNGLYQSAKALTEQTNGIRFMRYKDAFAQLPPVKALSEKIVRAQEAHEHDPSGQTNEKVRLYGKQLKSLQRDKQMRLDAKSLADQHNRRIKKSLFVRDALWEAAKQTQNDFKTFKTRLETERQTDYFANKDFIEKTKNILWRRDLVERYDVGVAAANLKFTGAMLDKIKKGGYDKLLDQQKRENPNSKPELWREDLIAAERKILKETKSKNVDAQIFKGIKEQARIKLLKIQSKGKTQTAKKSQSIDLEM